LLVSVKISFVSTFSKNSPMPENDDRISELLAKLEALLKRQDGLSREINAFRAEIYRLNSTRTQNQPEEKEPIKKIHPENTADIGDKKATPPASMIQQAETVGTYSTYSPGKSIKTAAVKSDFEKFVGENLISKIGIVITIIGVAIGTKYTIEHDLISPLTRIILGYLMGLGLLGFGIKLKKKYETYSSVLVSGAMSILYFITYFAYSYYDLMPQLLAFVLMAIFTVFTVVAAINYDKQVIAHIGLVGAYAVPFLLSDGSGRVVVLFSYMAIINIGILLIAFRKNWRPLYFSAFILTWLIYFVWYMDDYNTLLHFGSALIFLSIFFTIFYSIFLNYKIAQNEKFSTGDVVLLLANSFIFYGIGYSILNSHHNGEQLLGLFTLCNAVIHFVVSVIIYKKKLVDKNLFFLVAGLVLVFLTIAIPVQLDGHWVTLSWVFEATLLFYIGRTKNAWIYEKLSYPLLFIAFFSLVQDWLGNYDNYSPGLPGSRISPIININFLTSVLFVTSLIIMNYLHKTREQPASMISKKLLHPIISFSIPAILIIVLYFSFWLEIFTYWSQLYTDSYIELKKAGQQLPDQYYWNYDLLRLQTVWLINYSLLFLSILSLANIKKFKIRNLAEINLGLNAIAMIVFLTLGLQELGALRESYLNQTLSSYYNRSGLNIGIRYISYGFAALMLISTYRYLKAGFINQPSRVLKIVFDLLLHVSILCVVSSEMITWMNAAKFSQSHKLGLSILWGIYALTLIAVGIRKNQRHLRIGAIGLFALTLIKLFFYDISHLDTIAKTVVFVSLGILLLIISFLYNKYKHLISEKNEN
jgi:hypothetical protein